ncbi:hypothetical protein EYF80_036138 [Liparis tanakae]|uniref:Uncharacterized protein n=1 Tax=Liparis tanakae TaxID=230148 RepID=A0A4Z2GLZ3_9TELE|nr:hypothetical protein EYF80_036138 [Liparis tanakae]
MQRNDNTRSSWDGEKAVRMRLGFRAKGPWRSRLSWDTSLPDAGVEGKQHGGQAGPAEHPGVEVKRVPVLRPEEVRMLKVVGASELVGRHGEGGVVLREHQVRALVQGPGRRDLSATARTCGCSLMMKPRGPDALTLIAAEAGDHFPVYETSSRSAVFSVAEHHGNRTFCFRGENESFPPPRTCRGELLRMPGTCEKKSPSQRPAARGDVNKGIVLFGRAFDFE